MTRATTAELARAEAAAQHARVRWRTGQLLAAAARLMERNGFAGVSIQAIADEAAVSVGLVYRYFGSKEELLLAVITDVLDEFATRVPEAMAAAGDDPVERIAAGFRAYCQVIHDHRHAAMLTYRESRALSVQGRARIKRLEVQTSEPLREAIRQAVERGLLLEVDADLVSYDLLLLSHSWALKHWLFERSFDLDSYVAGQTALVLRGVLRPEHRRRYRHLLEAGP